MDVEGKLWSLQRTPSSSQQVQREFTRLLVKKSTAHGKLQQHSRKLRCLITAKSVAEQWAVGQPLHTTTLSRLALAFYDRGSYTKGLPLLIESVQVLRGMSEEISEAELARSLANLAMGFLLVGRPYKGLPLAKEAVELCQRSTCVDDASRAAHMDSLSLIYEGLGDFQRAAELLEESIRLVRQADPSLWLAQSIYQLAAVYCRMEDRWTAQDLFREAQDVSIQASRSDHHDVIRCQCRRSSLESTPEDSLHKCGPLRPAWPPDVAVGGNRLGRVYTLQGLDPRLTLSQVHVSADRLAALCELHRTQGRIRAAMTFAKQCLEVRRKLVPNSHPDIGRTLYLLAKCHMGRREYCQASVLFSWALWVFRASFDMEHPVTDVTLQNLKASYFSARKFDEISSECKDYLDFCRRTKGGFSQPTFDHLTSLCEEVLGFWRSNERFSFLSGWDDVEASELCYLVRAHRWAPGTIHQCVYVFQDAIYVLNESTGQLKDLLGVLEAWLSDSGSRNVPITASCQLQLEELALEVERLQWAFK